MNTDTSEAKQRADALKFTDAERDASKARINQLEINIRSGQEYAKDKCRYCGQPIRWAVYNGKNIPLDYEPVQIGGNYRFILESDYQTAHYSHVLYHLHYENCTKVTPMEKAKGTKL